MLMELNSYWDVFLFESNEELYSIVSDAFQCYNMLHIQHQASYNAYIRHLDWFLYSIDSK